ncbi:MAG: stage II sporulation protein R [Oscillospiraceae bacterium]|nr:stage II sporulation protein R [Oscillospiraceae bacterium]
MKKMEIAAIMGMAGALLISSLGQEAAAYHSIEENVLRLHILANSDSMEDQLLKYEVRDEILRKGSVYFENISTPEEAVYTAESCLQYLEEIARETVADKGYDYAVNAELVTMTFDERTYEDVTLPAGVYDAVRITIGEAAGQNWWCVMYPPLCIPAVTEDAEEDETLEKYFTDEEEELLTQPEKIRYKLKCAEWLKEAWNRLCE